MIKQEINELNKHTDNIDILRLVLNLDSRAINDIISLYNKLDDTQMAQEKKDTMVEYYIKQHLYTYKDKIKHVLSSKISLATIAAMPIDQIKSFMKKYSETKQTEKSIEKQPLINDQLQTDIFAMKHEAEKRSQINRLNKILIELDKSDDFIDKVIGLFGSIEFYETRNALFKFIGDISFYDDKEDFDIKIIIKYFKDIKTKEHLDCVTKLLSFVKDKEDININELFKTVDAIMQDYDNLSFMITKELFANNTLDEIEKLMELYLLHPHLKILINKVTIRQMTYEQFSHLIEMGQLLVPDNMEIVGNELYDLLGDESCDDIYLKLLEFIAKDEYETTVSAYIKECASIQEFINYIDGLNVEGNKNLTLETII